MRIDWEVIISIWLMSTGILALWLVAMWILFATLSIFTCN